MLRNLFSTPLFICFISLFFSCSSPGTAANGFGYYEASDSDCSYFIVVDSPRESFTLWSVPKNQTGGKFSNAKFEIDNSDYYLSNGVSYAFGDKGKIHFKGEDKLSLKSSEGFNLSFKSISQEKLDNGLISPVLPEYMWITGVWQTHDYSDDPKIAFFPDGHFNHSYGYSGSFSIDESGVYLWKGDGTYEHYDSFEANKWFSNVDYHEYKTSDNLIYYTTNGARYDKILNDISSGTVSDEDCFLKVEYIASDLEIGIPSYYLFKLYSKLQINSFDGASYPSFDGFEVVSERSDSLLSVYRESVDNKEYYVMTLREYLSTPREETVSIKPMGLKLTALNEMVFDTKEYISFEVYGHSITLNPRPSESEQVVKQEITSYDTDRISLVYTYEYRNSEFPESGFEYDVDISGFNITFGPQVGKNSSVKHENNVRQVAIDYTWKYLLESPRSGTVIVPAIHLQSDGRKYVSGECLVKLGDPL